GMERTRPSFRPGRSHQDHRQGPFGAHEGRPAGVELLPWAWEDRGHYLFNLCVEKRSLGKSIRCLIAATGFYIYTMPTHPGQQQDQHLFRLKGRDWFWIAGIIRHGAFAMLTRTYAAMPSDRKSV